MEQNIIYTLAAVLTICVFSFLWKDNPLYKFAEHLVVGVSAGYFTIIVVKTSLLPKLIDPIKRVVTGTSTTFLDPLVFIPVRRGAHALHAIHPEIRMDRADPDRLHPRRRKRRGHPADPADLGDPADPSDDVDVPAGRLGDPVGA